MSQRARAIRLRMALGAERTDVLRLVMLPGVALTSAEAELGRFRAAPGRCDEAGVRGP